MGGQTISNVAGPVNAGDAANKGYVDNRLAGFAMTSGAPTGAGGGAPPPGAAGGSAGGGANCTGTNCIAAGNGANANGDNTTAIGAYSNAQFAGSTAIGYGAQASADPTTAVGAFANASGNNSVALGANSSTRGANAIAVGEGAHADHDNAIAIGRHVSTTSANQVALGSASNTYTLAGLPSAASSAAQTGTTKFVTTDANGNLAAAEYGAADVNRAFQKIDENVQGIAVAIALGGMVVPEAKTFAIAANVGFYDDKQAFAAQAAYRLGPNTTLSGGVGFGLNDASRVGGRVGIMTAW
jgi:trimeric autotransporter adhesin